jgi:GTP-binding protein
MDMPEAEENLKEFKKQIEALKEDEFSDGIPIFPISSVSRTGIEPLLKATADLVDITPEFPMYQDEEIEEVVHYQFVEDEPDFQVTRDDDATWVLYGAKLEKLFIMTNFDREESIMKFARQLRGMGVDETLRSMGAKDGDLVRIKEFVFEFVD